MTETKRMTNDDEQPVKVTYVVQCYWPKIDTWRDESAPSSLEDTLDTLSIIRSVSRNRQFRIARYTTTMRVVQEETHHETTD